jgi:hypothetical protein
MESKKSLNFSAILQHSNTPAGKRSSRQSVAELGKGKTLVFENRSKWGMFYGLTFNGE